jgi:hypothetical protein
MATTATGLSDERAARFMVALRKGTTPHLFGVKLSCVEAYCAIHQEYAREARPLIEANAKAARQRKGAHLRDRTHCKHGHSYAGARVYIKDGFSFRFCAECRKVDDAKGGILKPAVGEKIKAALKSPTATIKSIIHAGSGHIVTYVALQAYRRADPEIDALVSGVIATSATRWQRRRRLLVRNDAIREQSNDYSKIRAMLPAGFPDKDDVVSDIFEALLDGSLRREDVKARVSTYVSAHNRRFPTKYAKFGNSPLVSLDEVMFENGSATLGDTVSRGLWD